MRVPGIVTSARTMAYYSRLQDVTANNLANVSTDAFKATRMTAHLAAGQDEPQPVAQVDLTQGGLEQTGMPLDTALEGPGFLVVRTANGERLTRGGRLQIDTQGRLTDRNGNPVLGTDGQPIHPSDGQVTVREDGTVIAGDTAIGQLKLVTVDAPARMTKEGAGLFVPSGPLRPAAATRVHQGMLEQANMDPLHGLVDLITMQRAYTANVDALKAQDGALGAIVNDVGRAS